MITPPHTVTTITSILAASLLAVSSVSAQTIVGTNTDVALRGNNTLGDDTAQLIRAGSSFDAGGIRNALMVFQLPDFGAVSNPFSSADLEVTVETKTANATTFNVDVYGLGRQSSPTLSIGSGVLTTNRAYNSSTIDPTATLFQQSIVLSSDGPGTYNTDSTGDANLLAFLNAQYDSGTGAGEYIIVRLNPDADTGTSIRGFNFAAASNDIASIRPMIHFTAIPEPQTVLYGIGIFAGAIYLRRRLQR